MKWMTSGLVAAVMALTSASVLARDKPQGEPEGQPTEPDNQEAARPRLGVMITELTPELRTFFGAPEDHGVLVARIVPGTPAARAGLHVGDVLVSVKGQGISEPDDVLDVLSTLGHDEAFPVTLIRAGKVYTLTAKLRDQPPRAAAPGASTSA